MTDIRRSQSEEEAARWFATRRRGVMTIEERGAYEAWRKNPENVYAMAELEHVWSLLAVAQDRYGATKTDMGIAPRSGKVARSALVAAVCAVSLGIGILSYSGHNGFWTTLDWTDR